MRIICTGVSNNVQIIDNDGKNITESLEIAAITIKMEPFERVKAVLEIYADGIDIEVDKDDLSNEQSSAKST